ncbi:polymorphic toxin-type HINT domain-containing protein [Aquisphaera insulae]|uniref:polymorphic toxin-type HINT domain-containing protein n=1 Tax=Aquisphaera insulae TaxID=2712864 RepID=UPI0013EA09B2|nr:polymorphic toxin-type HINT domain-containing protein [Aquisphaera insulae]
MIVACWISLCLLAQAPSQATAPSSSSSVADAYQEARARAGHDPDALVGLALWCERRGLTAERLRSLSLAVLYRPDHEVARGLLGLVEARGKWKRPEDIRAAEEADPATRRVRQEYLARRARARPTADSQQELARWCEQNGLPDQASVHYRQVVQLAPDRAAAWKKLGYEKHGKRWALPADLAAARAEAEAQSQADKAWRPKLEDDREALAGKDAARRRLAEERLAAVEDPRAVPTICEVFVRKDAGSQLRAADILAQVQGPAASTALALLAVSSDFPEVRGRASQILSRRDPREFVGLLLDLVHRPFRVKVGSEASVASAGEILVEGEAFNVRRTYNVDPGEELSRMPARLFTAETPFLGGMDPQSEAAMGSLGGWFRRGGGNGLYQRALDLDLEIADRWAVIHRTAAEARGKMAQDVAGLESANRQIRDLNDRVLPILKLSTGQDFGEDRDAWKRWWFDQLGAVHESSTPAQKPTYSETVSVQAPRVHRDYVEAPGELNLFNITHSACFVAGTTVHTDRGPAAIESLQVGDEVLSQDVRTGRISYRAVTAVHRNAPTTTLGLKLGDETVVATGIHRFWKPGAGWTMARDLRPGDIVRTLGGTSRVSAIEPGPITPVFNLEVAENHDFFVGKAGHLVYDYSLVRPALAPFDALPQAVAAR